MDGNTMHNKEPDHVLVIGEKESFLIRVLLKKLTDANISNQFVPMDVSVINEHWDGTDLVTLYLDTDNRVKPEILAFLNDRLTDSALQMVVIANEDNNARVKEALPKSLIYRSFDRPLDAEGYMDAVAMLFLKMAAGEYKKSILIVDDDPTYLGVVREWLRDTYKVAVVSSGLQALKWLGKNKADLILLDYEMPVTSGPQVLEMLRSDHDTRNIPVMFLTGRGDKESVMQVLNLKPEGYLLKNIERHELLEKIGSFFIKQMGEQ